MKPHLRDGVRIRVGPVSSGEEGGDDGDYVVLPLLPKISR